MKLSLSLLLVLVCSIASAQLPPRAIPLTQSEQAKIKIAEMQFQIAHQKNVLKALKKEEKNSKILTKAINSVRKHRGWDTSVQIIDQGSQIVAVK